MPQASVTPARLDIWRWLGLVSPEAWLLATFLAALAIMSLAVVIRSFARRPQPGGDGKKLSAQTENPLPEDDATKSVRIFISSTFLDMQRERDILVKEVFPALRDKFRPRGVELREVDLRWGISREQSERGETLPILLAEIDRCRPYFIALLGDRYGWTPPESAFTEDLKAAYPWIGKAAGRSVTELEIMHGLFAAAPAATALVFERRRKWSWVTGVNRAALARESKAERTSLARLKVAIRRKVRRVERYASPEAFGRTVLRLLSTLLDAQFPAMEETDAVSQSVALHRAYSRDRRGLHVGAGSYRSALDEWMTRPDAPPILIVGASGGGKSTLIANWANEWRTRHPNDIVVEHYLGASPDSADPVLLMRHVWEHLNRATGEVVDLPAGDADLMAISSAFGERLSRASVFAARAGGVLLVALDGLDQLSSETGLRWLPNVPRVKLLASSLDSVARTAAASLGWTELPVRPLNDAEREELTRLTLAGWGRTLPDELIAAVLAHPQTRTPLFLKTVLDELRVSATHARLADRTKHYLAAVDVPDLFSRVLERLETDCGNDLVARSMSLIWGSRAGLEEAEILAMTAATPLAWAAVRNGLGDSLRDQAGRLTFSHDYLRQAVAKRYLQSETAAHAIHLAIADRFERRVPDMRQAEELPFQLRNAKAWERLEALLVDLEHFHRLHGRGAAELLGHWLSLAERGSDLEVLLCGALERKLGDRLPTVGMEIALVFSLLGFFAFSGKNGDPVMRMNEQLALACEKSFGRDSKFALESKGMLGQRLSDAGQRSKAEQIEREVLDSFARVLGAEHGHTLIAMNNLARTLRWNGDLQTARMLNERALEIRTRTLGPEHPATLASLGNLAGVLSDLDEPRKAIEIEQRVLALRHRALGSEHPDTLSAMSAMVVSHIALGEYAAAKALQSEELEISTRLFGADHPSTLVAASNLASAFAELDDFQGARQLYERVIEARSRTLGAEHPSTIQAMANLAVTLSQLGDFGGAQGLNTKVLEARTRLLGPSHPASLFVMNNLAMNLEDIGDYEGALALQERVVDLMSSAYGAEHRSTLTASSNLASVLQSMGRTLEARDIKERVLDARMRVLGPDHPNTLNSLNNLGDLLKTLGELQRAKELHVRAVAAYTRTRGPEHTSTLTSMHNLALTLRSLDELDDAMDLQQRVLDGRRDKLGSDHPHTRAAENELERTVKALQETHPPAGLPN